MNHSASLTERLQVARRPTGDGVIGITNRLLDMCRQQNLYFEWHEGICRVQTLGADTPESAEIPLQKSVFRAILARISHFCNEVSPYGGEGDIVLESDPLTTLSIAFTNTPDVQQIELRRKPNDKGGFENRVLQNPKLSATDQTISTSSVM
jgi:hypothetical protein